MNLTTSVVADNVFAYLSSKKPKYVPKKTATKEIDIECTDKCKDYNSIDKNKDYNDKIERSNHRIIDNSFAAMIDTFMILSLNYLSNLSATKLYNYVTLYKQLKVLKSIQSSNM